MERIRLSGKMLNFSVKAILVLLLAVSFLVSDSNV